MASSGSYESKIAGGSTGGYYVGVEWKVDSQTSNPPNSKVTASVYVRSSGNGYTISSTTSKDVSVTINGTKYTGTNSIGIGQNTKKILLTKTVDVPHNSDGTKSCAFAGSFYVGFTLSGTSLKTVSTSGTGYFDNIQVNSPPSMGGTVRTNPSGTISETTSSITVSWDKASDSQNNADKYQIYRYVNGAHSATFNVNNINTLSYTDNISGFGEGTNVYYTVWAGDSFGTWSNGISSPTATKNSFNGAGFTGHSGDVGWGTTYFDLYVDGAWNSNGNTAFNYLYYSDDVTVYDKVDTNSKTGRISIWRDLAGGAKPSGAYIKQSELKEKFKNSNYNGRLHVGVRTTNSNGTYKWVGGSIGVDLRTSITVASGSTYINDSSFYTISGTKYAIPGRKNITLNWPKATDPLGTPIAYRVEQSINNGGWSTLYNGATGTSHSFSLNVSGKPTYKFRVIARNGYGWEKEISGHPSAVMYAYSAPSVSITGTTRTANQLTVNINTGFSSEISGNGIKSLRWTFGSKSGTLATNAKTFNITGLTESDSGTFSVIIEDNHGSIVGQGAVTVNGSVTRFYPVLSVRKNGVGINGTAREGENLYVNGRAFVNVLGQNGGNVTNFNDSLTEGEFVVAGSLPNAPISGEIYGKLIVKVSDGGTHNNSNNWIWHIFMNTGGRVWRRYKANNHNWNPWIEDLYGSDVATQSNVYGKIPRVGKDGVMEIGKFLDFHDGDNGQDYSARINCYGGKLETSGDLQANGLFVMRNKARLTNVEGSWLNGATNSSLLTDKLSTGSFHSLISQTTSSNHKVAMGGIDNKFGFFLYDANRTENGVDREFVFNMGDKTFYTNCTSTFGGRLHCHEWIYTNNGLYFPNNNGGWFMSDDVWVRSYADKSIYTGGVIQAGTNIKVTGGGKLFRMGNGGTDCYIHNEAGNGYMQFRDNGMFGFSNSAVWQHQAVVGKAEWAQVTIFPSADNVGNLGTNNYTWNTLKSTNKSLAASLDNAKSHNITPYEDKEYLYNTYKDMKLYMMNTCSTEYTKEETEETGNPKMVKLDEPILTKNQEIKLVCNAEEMPMMLAPKNKENETGNESLELGATVTGLIGAFGYSAEMVEGLISRIEELENRLNALEEL